MLKVAKFGGSSMADAGQYEKVRSIIRADDARKVVVVSAAGKRNGDDHKITDLLYLCYAHLQYGVDCSGVFGMIADRYREICRELGFRGALLIGHIGKLVKLAGGMWNTHSRYGDCRMDILTACAAAEGLHGGAAAEMLCCATCDDALRLLKEQGLYDAVLHRLAGRIDDMMHYKCSDIETGAILFSKEYGYLCETKGASKLLRRIKED